MSAYDIVEDDGKGGRKVNRSRKGTPQGGVISPLLANIFLHEYDKRFHSTEGPGSFANARLVRYADDWVIMARYIGPRILAFVDRTLADLDLTLNRDKTTIVNLNLPGNSIDFLGFTFRFDRSLRGPGRYLNVVPSAKSLKRARQKIHDMTIRRRQEPVKEVIGTVNRFLIGWGQYFRFGYPKVPFKKIDWYVQNRFRRFVQTRSHRRCRHLDHADLNCYKTPGSSR
ncbi:reverse transcriptase domain-containing protein [Thermodesulfobacteriota bacterium B35]